MQSDQTRWQDTKTFVATSPFSKSVAYKLLSNGKLRAKKLGPKTIWDAHSRDEYLASLPDFNKAA